MPRDIVIKLNTEIVRVLKHGEIAERFYQQGVEPVSSTPEEYAASNVKSEYTRWGEVVKESGITADQRRWQKRRSAPLRSAVKQSVLLSPLVRIVRPESISPSC